MEQKESAVKTAGFIESSIDDFISVELNYQSEIKAKLNKQVEAIGVVLLVIIIVLGIISIVGTISFSSNISRMITKLASYAWSIADGNLQLKTIDTESKDELLVLANSFNKMIGNLRFLIGKIGESSDNVALYSNTLRSNADTTASAIEQIAVSMQNVSEGASEQSEQTKKIASVTEGLFRETQKLNDDLSKVLVASNTATQAANIGNDKVELLIRQISNIEEKIDSTRMTTEKLNVATSDIKKILNTITTIAS